MNLTTAFRIAEGEVVAFVGGGGKTTTLFRLAQEIVDAGGRVITTTTTRIFAAQIGLAPTHLSAFEATRAKLAALLDTKGHVLLTGPVNTAEGKAAGITVGMLRELQQLPDLTAILIEADGSRMRPFKAPAAHEPVIPVETTLVVPVVGADVFGQPLTATHVHRAELVQALSGAALETPITPALVARIIAHAEGGCKHVPAAARVVPFLNKTETEVQQAQATTTANLLLNQPHIASVVVGAVKRADPVQTVWGRAAAIVLAAGQATRMAGHLSGLPKQLLPWGDTTVLGAVIRTLQSTALAEIVVVTGHAQAEVEAAVHAAAQGPVPVRCVFNPAYATGELAPSLQTGLRTLAPNCTAALAVLGDQPQLPAEVVEMLLARWRTTLAPVVAPFYNGQRANPVLFDRALWDALLALPPTANPRAVVQRVPVAQVPLPDDRLLHDLDTPEQYAALKARYGG